MEYTAATWDVPRGITLTQDARDSDEDTLVTYDTVYDNDDNVYDVYYDVNDDMDVGYGYIPGAKRPNGSWSDGVR